MRSGRSGHADRIRIHPIIDRQASTRIVPGRSQANGEFLSDASGPGHQPHRLAARARLVLDGLLRAALSLACGILDRWAAGTPVIRGDRLPARDLEWIGP